MSKSKSSSSSSPLSDSGSSGVSLLRDRWSRRISRSPLVVSPDNFSTQQQFKSECDMNNIVRDAQRGVQPRFLNPSIPQFGDFSDVPDLATAFNLIQDAHEAFMNLPAPLRAELGNDPSRINELTRDQAQRFNLLQAPQTPTSTPQPADPAPAPVQGAPGSKKEPKTE